MITELMPLAQAEGRASRVAALSLAKATIALHRGNRRAATKELVHAISVGARGHDVRPFVDQVETVVELVNDTKISSWPFVLSEEREFFAHICRSLPISDRFLHELSTFAASDQRAPAKPTRREVELLQLVNLGLSNDQIADRTEASVNTVKWHLNNLYRKLGVSNRSAALARARALSLLPK